MQKTWLDVFHEQTDLNQYPITLRTRGGIGYRKPNGETVSNFVGHPVHYFENGLWKPITLQPHPNGGFEGSDFAWRGRQVFYKGKTLFEPRAVIFNGIRHNLFLRQDGNRIVADLNFEGSAAQYEIIFSEKGVKELLTIFEPVEGLVEFDVPHAQKPDGLYKRERHIVGGDFGESFMLTKDMKFPLVIDPDYAGTTGDGIIAGLNAVYATARGTAYTQNSSGSFLYTVNQLGGGDYYIYRSILKIDTSGIPDGDSVTQANLSLHCVDKTVPTTNFDVQIVKANWSASDPLDDTNKDTVYDLGLTESLDDNIWQNSASVTAGNRYSSGNLNTAWVSKTSYTYYMLVNSNDRGNSAPSDNQTLEFASQDNATSGNRPYLTVTHAAGGGNTSNFFFAFP